MYEWHNIIEIKKYPLPENNLYGPTCRTKPSTACPPTQARKPSSQANNATITYNSYTTLDAGFVPKPWHPQMLNFALLSPVLSWYFCLKLVSELRRLR